MASKEQKLGPAVRFLLPSLKLKQRSGEGGTAEEEVHRFLVDRYGGYTASTGNVFGYWKDHNGNQSYGEHREFTVALGSEERLPELKQYLGELASDLTEDCLYVDIGGQVLLIYATP